MQHNIEKYSPRKSTGFIEALFDPSLLKLSRCELWQATQPTYRQPARGRSHLRTGDAGGWSVFLFNLGGKKKSSRREKNHKTQKSTGKEEDEWRWGVAFLKGNLKRPGLFFCL